jgi:hypothetical protein
MKHRICTACKSKPVAPGNYFLCADCYRAAGAAEIDEEHKVHMPKGDASE